MGFLYGAEDYAYGGTPLYASVHQLEGSDDREEELGTNPGKHCRPYIDSECMAEGDMTAHATSKYFALDFWEDQAPAAALARSVYYSTNFYTERTLSILRNFTAARTAEPAQLSAARRLWIHLCYQAVHSPFTDVPAWERLDPPYLLNGDETYGNMLSVMDTGFRNITHQLKSSGLWNETLLVSFSDNGGPTSPTGPNNHPLRGSKESPYEGGTRTFAIVSGGYLPAALRGTVSHSFIHAADWYT